MKIHRIQSIILRHFYELRRNFDRVTDMVYWPILDVMVWGFFTVYLAKNETLGTSIVQFLLGATVLWSVFYSFQRDMAVGFLDELWSRNLLNLFATPLSILEYITGLIIINIAKVCVGFFFAAGLALILYSFNIFPFALQLLPYFFNLLFFGLSLGIGITALIFRYTTKVQGFAWSFSGLLQPVSCVFYPLSTLPVFMQKIAWFLPTTHIFEGMRQILAHHGFSFPHFWWGFGLNILYFLFSLFLFRFIFDAAKKRGLLVKLD